VILVAVLPFEQWLFNALDAVDLDESGDSALRVSTTGRNV
jgi:hypothetical protein